MLGLPRVSWVVLQLAGREGVPLVGRAFAAPERGPDADGSVFEFHAAVEAFRVGGGGCAGDGTCARGGDHTLPPPAAFKPKDKKDN